MEDKDIKLFDHNEEAYQKLKTSLEINPLAFLEHATGTGKSMILLKYLYTKMRDKRILFISLHDEMFEQLFESQMKTLNMNRSDFKKFDTLIYHNIVKQVASELIEKYDCFVFDEAHHCGATKWGKVILELKNLVKRTPGKVMIGTTATGIRYLDDYLDVAEKYFDGNVVSKLPVSTAILKNLLPAALYINSSDKCLNKINRIETILKKVPQNEMTSNFFEKISEMKKKISKDCDIKTLFERYDVKQGEKYIVFCKNIKDLKQKMKEAESWFSCDVKMFQAHSGQKKEKNKLEISEFSKDRPEISLMFAVDIFNEGFHLDNVDGIFMFRKTKSPIVYFQQIGRALSFSVRKKQIKIFDFVDNISDNDVITELYKEIICEARRLIKEEPENKELYEEILSRFKIIDNTSSMMDVLNDLETTIREEFFIKNKIEQAIMHLEEYRYFNPKTSFFDEITLNRVSPVYVKAFKYLIDNREYLTIDQVSKMNKLNIDFGESIEFDIEKRKNELGIFKNYKELEKHKFETFIDKYIEFYEKNNFRPKFDSVGEEYELYGKYRFYLSTLTKRQILKIVEKFPFKLTLEELVLTGGLVEKEEIDSYFDSLRNKINAGIILDMVERRVLARLRNAINRNDSTLISYTEKNNSPEFKINTAIKILQKYKEAFPKEDFSNLVKFHTNLDILRAYNTIIKYAKKVDNTQFKMLLDLKIKLPVEIDMTMEERLDYLKGTSSIFEKEQLEKNNIINQYVNFIKINGRRPNIDDKREQNLAVAYYDHLFKTSVSKLKSIALVLKTSDIPLSFFEKALSGEKLSEDEITTYIERIKDKIERNDSINRNELKILRAINNYQQYYNREYLEVIIKSQKYALDFEEFMMNPRKSKSDKSGYIASNHKFVSKKMIGTALALGIEVSPSLIEEVNKLEKQRTFYEKEMYEHLKFLEDFKEYVNTKKYRPEKNSYLDKKYREYISKLHYDKLQKTFELFHKNGIPLMFEEKVLIGKFEHSKIDEYVKSLENRLALDSLERRVYNLLLGFIDSKVNVPSVTIRKENIIEEKIYNSLVEKINNNPLVEIEDYFEKIYLSASNVSKLVKYRKDKLACMYLPMILNKLRQYKSTMEVVLNKEEMQVFAYLVKSIDITNPWFDLINTIKELDYRNSFFQEEIEYQEFLDEYIKFVTEHSGIRPDENSVDETEKCLAIEYKKVVNLLSKTDLKLIEDAVSDSIQKSDEESFYQNFIDFILNNLRFPCMNSSDEEELRLANLFVSINKKLSKDEQSYINILRKKYMANTMKASMNFNKERLKK